VAAAGLNLVFGRWEFAGFDVSPLIDAAWRVEQAQIPNVHFICTFPPSTYLPLEWAFRLFGIRWLSVLLIEDVVYLLLCILGLRLCAVLGRPETSPESSPDETSPEETLAWVYVAAQTAVMLCVNHLWHSTTASGFAAYAVLATYVLLQPTLAHRRWEATAHLGFAWAVLLLSKPNTGWTAVLLCLGCLLLSRCTRVAACLACVTAVVADILLLGAFHMTAWDVLRGYRGLAGRAVPKLFLVGLHPNRSPAGVLAVLLIYGLLAAPAYWLARLAWANHARWLRSPEELVCLGAAVVTLIGLGTNWDAKVVDVPPFFVGAALLATLHGARYGRMLRPLQWSAGLFCVFALLVGLARVRMIADGAWAGPAYGQKVWLHDKFLGDFRGRQRLAEMLKESDQVVAQAPGERVFFGPQMEFLYARDRLTSPLHLPLWWHPGTSYSESNEGLVESAWLADHFDVLIFAKDRMLFPKPLLKQIHSRYRLDDSMETIDVFYKDNR
jgi:hypothetical protein